MNTTDIQTYTQSYKQKGRQTDRHAVINTNRRKGRQTDRQAVIYTNRQKGRRTESQSQLDRLYRIVQSLICWFFEREK